MTKKILLLPIAATTLVVVLLAAFFLNVGGQSLALSSDKGVADKAPSESFTVTITFKNTGKSAATWAVNVAFEGRDWTWSGTSQVLTLAASKTKTLKWNGNVPADASVGSVSRLVVYYNDSFLPLDWWIHVVSNAELSIRSSTVE